MTTKNHKKFGVVTISDTMLMTPNRFIPLKNVYGINWRVVPAQHKQVFDSVTAQKEAATEPPLALTEKEFYKTLDRKLPLWFLENPITVVGIANVIAVATASAMLAIKPFLSLPFFVLPLLFYFTGQKLKRMHKNFLKQFEEHYRQRTEARKVWQAKYFSTKEIKPEQKVLILLLKDEPTQHYEMCAEKDDEILDQIKQTIEEKIMNLA